MAAEGAGSVAKAKYSLAPALDELRDEIDRKWPHRSKASDGWIGNAAHRARKSDHNPDANGVVHAIDVTTPNTRAGRRMGRTIKKACLGDPRIWYVIWRGHIWSQTHGWKKRPYVPPPGGSTHFDHLHISANYNRAEERDRGTWRLDSIWSRLFGRLAGATGKRRA